MKRRVILSPSRPGSRTPAEFRAAAEAVIARSEAAARANLFPLQKGSRTPEEIDAAVEKVMADRDHEDWKLVTIPPPEDDDLDEDH